MVCREVKAVGRELTTNTRTCGNNDESQQSFIHSVSQQFRTKHKKQGPPNEKETPNNENGDGASLGDGRKPELAAVQTPPHQRPSVRPSVRPSACPSACLVASSKAFGAVRSFVRSFVQGFEGGDGGGGDCLSCRCRRPHPHLLLVATVRIDAMLAQAQNELRVASSLFSSVSGLFRGHKSL